MRAMIETIYWRVYGVHQNGRTCELACHADRARAEAYAKWAASQPQWRESWVEPKLSRQVEG